MGMFAAPKTERLVINESRSPTPDHGHKTSRLLQVVRKWRAYTARRRKSRIMTCALSLSRCGALYFQETEDEEGDDIMMLPSSKQPTTPRGYLAVYVGSESRRFLVKAESLNHPLFNILLNKAQEEFGFDQKGPLNIPCDTALFEHILKKVEHNDALSP